MGAAPSEPRLPNPEAAANKASTADAGRNTGRETPSIYDDRATISRKRVGGVTIMKVLLVSSYKVSCGIAAYAEALETLLARDFDVSVHALDQSILRSRVPHVVKTGDQQIRDLCAQFKNYDVVNLQWEPGILANRADLMARRLGWILDAADNLVLTVHTVVPYPEQRGLIDFLSFVRKQGIKGAYRYFFNPEPGYRKETYRLLHARARSDKRTAVAVHTDREKHFFRNVVGFKNVHDHPLSLVHADWPERLAQDAPRARRELEDAFPGKHTFIGVFGFLSEYKGTLTALNAMKLLDGGHQLLIYGGVHPGMLKERQPVDAYVKKLMDEIEADALRGTKGAASSAPVVTEPAALDVDDTGGASPAPVVIEPAALEVDDTDAQLDAGAPARQGKNARPGKPTFSNAKPSNTLLDKVAFLGTPDDYEFALAMKAVDICLFPYLEVGQSGSGPVSIAVELRKPTIISRTKAFIEFTKYHPKNVEMIDIGNHIQLAQTVKRLSNVPASQAPVTYTNQTLAKFYGDLIRGTDNRASNPVVQPIRLETRGTGGSRQARAAGA